MAINSGFAGSLTRGRSVFDFWKPRHLAHERARDPVLASLAAVGLLGVAQTTQRQEPMDAARKRYGQALQLTNAALRDPIGALEDTTLLSVLVLCLFETMADPGGRSMRAWQQHIKGAAALARMRGTSQFRSSAGVKMFMMLCGNIVSIPELIIPADRTAPVTTRPDLKISPGHCFQEMGGYPTDVYHRMRRSPDAQRVEDMTFSCFRRLHLLFSLKEPCNCGWTFLVPNKLLEG